MHQLGTRPALASDVVYLEQNSPTVTDGAADQAKKERPGSSFGLMPLWLQWGLGVGGARVIPFQPFRAAPVFTPRA